MTIPGSQAFLLEREEEVVGVILWCLHDVSEDGLVFELAFVAIAPQFRGQGLGKRLVRETLARVRAAFADWNVQVIAWTDRDSEAYYLARSLRREAKIRIKRVGIGRVLILAEPRS